MKEDEKKGEEGGDSNNKGGMKTRRGSRVDTEEGSTPEVFSPPRRHQRRHRSQGHGHKGHDKAAKDQEKAESDDPSQEKDKPAKKVFF